MLKYLSIKNLILIQNIEIFFQNGLCILTGETGAGKSMILDSLSLITGGRTKSSIKPEKGKKTIVTAQIDISNFQDIKKELNKLDIAVENDLIIKRTISDDGKSKSFINDCLVSLSTLKQATNGIKTLQQLLGDSVTILTGSEKQLAGQFLRKTHLEMKKAQDDVIERVANNLGINDNQKLLTADQLQVQSQSDSRHS